MRVSVETNHIMPNLHILNIPQPLRRRHKRKNFKHHIIRHLPGPDIPRDKSRNHSRRQLDVAQRHHDARGDEEDDVHGDGEDEAVPGEPCVVYVEECHADAEDGEEDAGVPVHGDFGVFCH